EARKTQPGVNRSRTAVPLPQRAARGGFRSTSRRSGALRSNCETPRDDDMNASTRLVKLATITTALLAIQGCNDDSQASVDQLDLRFRTGGEDRDGPDKLNTSFLGADEQIPFNNLPRAADAEPNVELL